ncbi:MAG: host attachment protein, partial [Rhodomicrobium sp.]|nr:host attachment protein [Rhodomicrobium sp.]
MTELKIEAGEWVVVCDGRRALILANEGDAKFPNLRMHETHEHDDAKTSDQGTDRPGRVHESATTARSTVEQTDWHDQAETEFLHEVARRLDVGDNLLRTRQNSFLEPLVLPLHDPLRNAVDHAVLLVSADSLNGGRSRVELLRHVPAEVVGQLRDARLRPHLRLGCIPEGRRHRKQEQAVVHEMRQEQLLVVKILPVSECGGECRTRHGSRTRIDKSDPPGKLPSEH